MSIIPEHLLDEEPFWAMCQYISADANGNGVVNDLDIDEIQDCILGVSLPLMPSWTYIASHWTTVYSSQDFFDWMTMLDPTPEDFEDFYAEYYEAFNRIDNSTLVVGEYSTTYSTPPYTYDQGIEFNGFKLGDVNYTVTPFDDCPGLWEGPNEVISTRNASILGRESIAEVTLKSYYYTSELEIFIDNISEIKALQIEIPFEVSDVFDIKLLSTTLPMFTDANYHYDIEANVLRCVWFDRKAKQELRNKSADSKTTLEFKVSHTKNSEISISNPTDNSFNLIGMYGNKVDVPLTIAVNMASTSKEISYSLNGSLMEFYLDGYNIGHAELRLYTVTGQFIGGYKSPIIDQTVRFILPTRKGGQAAFVYQLLTPIQSQTGKIIIFE